MPSQEISLQEIWLSLEKRQQINDDLRTFQLEIYKTGTLKDYKATRQRIRYK